MNEAQSTRPARRVSERRVPNFDASPLDSMREMNRLQRSFYTRDFRPGVLRRDPVEVNGQPGFALRMRHELMEARASDPEMNEHLRFLARAYPDRQSFPLSRDTLADTYFFDNDLAGAYHAYDHQIPLTTHLSLARELGYPRLSAATIMWWGGPGLLTRTKHGLGSIDAIMDRLQQTLDEFHDALGISVIDDFWQRLSAGTAEDAAQAVLPDVVARYDRDDVRRLVSHGRSSAEARRGITQLAQPRPVSFAGLFDAKFRSLMRDSENEVRSVAGVPSVGQGWVSEMTLLRELQAAFPHETIVHQARPGWLAPQSLDIYFPDYAVGVEYQGVQHSRPVDYFGGAEAYERQTERDLLKRSRVQEAGGVLIEVQPEYRLTDVVQLLRDAIGR